ncbi:MAG: Mn(2+) uptake NRAMP transporter MntH [Acidobacteria bacterium]|nr:Mn(2+) uptake NRAMP transporter MntH [Acidobacteriota bacterium]
MIRQGSAQVRSLPEVHGSVPTGQKPGWRRLFAFAGPAYLVSVGYMDPGNWATDLEGGARFGYQLVWVLVMSNLMAILLQSLSARLGIVSGRDLAQACRESYPRPVNFALWVLCEVAIAACDLAEVLGAAIGLNLLFKIPLLAGVGLTAFDTLVFLWLTRFGIRVIEAFLLALVATIAGCFLVEIWLAQPSAAAIAAGLVPRLTDESLYVAIGILGATVMPHNLYLHSALVQTRDIGSTDDNKRDACRFNLIDSVVALNGALLVNGAILVLAGSVFFTRGLVVNELQQAHELLSPLLGTALGSILFAVALLCSGQSSTLTGTLAGQIVMEGFLNIRMRPWMRRLITRSLAIVPAAITISIMGEKGTYSLLILSQVILSLQLPFAIIPLIQFTSDKARMGPFASPAWVRALAWLAAVIIVGLNLRLVWGILSGWLTEAGDWRWLIAGIVIPLALLILGLLAWVALAPILPGRTRRSERAVEMPALEPAALPVPSYRAILVPLDHSDRDRVAIAHAAAIARSHGARIHLLHVEEGVTSQLYGPLSSTAEVEAGARYIESIAAHLRASQIAVEPVVCHAKDPAAEIVAEAQRVQADLVVMGAHGHTGIKDLLLGNTINRVRHELTVPVLVVR